MTTLLDKSLPSFVKNTPPLKALFRPMLAVALGLHGLLLFVPLSPAKKELPQPTEKPVKISRLSNQKVAIKPKPKPRVATSKPVVKRNVSPPPTLVVKATPTPSPAPSSASSTTTPSPSPSASPSSPADNTPSNDPEAAAFAGPLDAITRPRTDTDGVEKDLPVRETSVPIGSFLFRDPTLFFTDPDNDLVKPGVSAVEFLGTLNDLDAALKDDIEPAYTGNGFTFTKVGEYGEGPVYEVKDKDGVTRYLNFVLNKSKTGILVVVWKKSPV
jgi:hypothetical protein